MEIVGGRGEGPLEAWWVESEWLVEVDDGEG